MFTPEINRRSWLSAAAVSLVGLQGKLQSAQPAAPGQWPCWRGPTRDGHCSHMAWPKTLQGLKKSWTVALGDSYSGPITCTKHVYTTQTLDAQFETLTALNIESGETVWERKWAGALSVPFFAKSNGDWIRSTPACDGHRIVVGGIRDVFACFECETGNELWRIDFNAKLGSELPTFGCVCSPLIDGADLYVQAGGGVRKLNMDSGELIWVALEDGGGMNGSAFSSPVIAELHGVRQLIVQTRTMLAGLDLQTGNPLWTREVAAFRGMNILTPTVWNNGVFTSSYGGKSELIAFSPTADQWKTDVVWAGKAEAYMSSPIVVADHLYLHLRNQRTCCIDLNSGEEVWRTTPFGKYWSMITNGEQILALDENGELLLVECNPEKFTANDRTQISAEPSWAHLALAGNQLFVRRQRGLDAYIWNG